MLLVAVAIWLFSRGIFRLPSVNPPSGGSSALVSQLDLRNRSVTRGSPEAQGQKENLIIPRGQLSLVILLPFGSEDGDYEVEVLRQVDHPLATGQGKATIKERDNDAESLSRYDAFGASGTISLVFGGLTCRGRFAVNLQ